MNMLDLYTYHLRDCGLSGDEARRVAQCRAAKPTRVGTIRAEKTEGESSEATLDLYDSIGFDFWTGEGMTPKRLAEQLDALKPFDRLTVRVNSPGGDVFDGMTIYNILRRQEATVAVEIEGLAASAASFIIQAASPGEIAVNEASMLMIHRAWGVGMGNFQDMLDLAGVLEKLDGQIAGIYSARSKRKVDTWLGLMDSETWFTGAEAVDAKLADKVIPAKRAAALADPSALNAYRNVPAGLADRLKALADDERREQEEAAVRERERAEREQEAVRVRLRCVELEAEVA